METIIQIKVKPFQIKVKFSGEVETYLLSNPSFKLVESEFLFSENSSLLFTAFLLSYKNHY